MKSRKTKKTTPTKLIDTDHGLSGGSGRTGVVRTNDYHTAAFEYWPRPTELQLAELAARLARTENIDPKQLINEAWSLYWESCQKIKEDQLEVARRLRDEEARDAALSPSASLGFPCPKRYPITFQEMELLLLPKLKGRTADRAALFREYLFAEMVGRNLKDQYEDGGASYWDFQLDQLGEWRELLEDTVAKEFGSLRNKLFDAQSYAKFSASFLQWYYAWTEVKNSEAKAANALKGWEKRRKARTAKTGARPKMLVLKQILQPPPAGT